MIHSVTSPAVIYQTIAMLRQRVSEIDRLIERLERERVSPHQVPKIDRCVHHRRRAKPAESIL